MNYELYIFFNFSISFLFSFSKTDKFLYRNEPNSLGSTNLLPLLSLFPLPPIPLPVPELERPPLPLVPLVSSPDNSPIRGLVTSSIAESSSIGNLLFNAPLSS